MKCAPEHTVKLANRPAAPRRGKRLFGFINVNALRYGRDVLNVFGDFPTLKDPRHADAYSPLWDAQPGLCDPQGHQGGAEQAADRRERGVRPRRDPSEPAHGRQPGTGQPQSYGSVGVDVNCAMIGYAGAAPTANLAQPAPGFQFPPR